MTPQDALSFLMLLNSTLLPMVMYLVYKMYDVGNTLGSLHQHYEQNQRDIDKLDTRLTSVENIVSSHEYRIIRLEEAVKDVTKH